jgi:CHAT domain-containing protein/uncharacterized protein GlcG (DUF336 family)
LNIKSTIILLLTFGIYLLSYSSTVFADLSPSYFTKNTETETLSGDRQSKKTHQINTADRTKQFQQLITAAENLRNTGEFSKAKSLLLQALALAQEFSDKPKIAIALGELGNIYTVLGPPQQAQKLLTQAEALARELNAPEITAAVLMNLGNFYAFQNQPDQASAAYQQSIQQAKLAKKATLIAKAQANTARIAVDTGQTETALKLLKQGISTVQQLPASRNKNYLLINLASSYLYLLANHPQLNNNKHIIYQLLIESIEAFSTSGSRRGLAYAQGLLGRLYEVEHRYAEALNLTQQALFSAQSISDKYLLYRWFWQKARIFKATGNINGAINAYRESIGLLDSLRFQMIVSYQAPGTVFLESIAPVYSQYIDLLLSDVSKLDKLPAKTHVLQEVRDTIESLKAAEIRDYFGDECVDALKAKSKPLWKANTSALIVYPVLLKDRTDLLLDFPDGSMKIRHVPISLSALTREIRTFRKLLEKRTTNEYRITGKKLYDWLIKPIIQEIVKKDIDTIVFVPDGPLLTIPIAALYDGKSHLIENYAVAITPGIQLIDPKQLSSEQIKPVLAGISESVAGYPALVYVQEELEYIQNLYGGKLLLNSDFQALALEESLLDQKVNLVHISTHAFLGKTAESSFLLTYDGRLPINTLADYVGLFKFRETPLELLVLSACETAQGDDKAALGLSGIAVRAGARSAIGSLWKVNDAATSILMEEFYLQFQQPGISRAKALQEAQMTVMKDLRFRHPGYWAAFLLINNWL